MADRKSFAVRARCAVCGAVFPASWPEAHHVCDRHSGLQRYEGVLGIEYDLAEARKAFPAQHQEGMWRYRALLPLPEDAKVPDLYVGLTPMYGARKAAESCGLKWIGLKDETRQPTGSFYDRGSALGVALALRSGYAGVAAAGCGAEIPSLAALAASAGVPCSVFVPCAHASEKYVRAAAAYGASVAFAEGGKEEAFEACMAACRDKRLLFCDPVRGAAGAEGGKTAAFEIAESVGWQTPGIVFAPVGDGSCLASLHAGFRELVEIGHLKKLPRLFGVEPEGRDFMCRAEADGLTEAKQLLARAPLECCGEKILPRDRVRAMRAVRETGGHFISVSRERMLRASEELAAGCGVLADRESALSLAGVYETADRGLPDGTEWAVCMLTGTGVSDFRGI